MKIGLVGASYQMRSLPFDAQRTVNLYPISDPKGKEISSLEGTPGLRLFAEAGIGAVRQGFVASNERAFIVSGTKLYELDSAGTATERGTIEQSSGNVTMDENATQLAVCDGKSLYIFTYATNTFAKVTDTDFPSSVGTVTAIDSYFVVNQNGTGIFFISDVGNGSSWQALEFATAEAKPDKLLRVINALGQLWLLGGVTGEVWTNTGASTFPFQRIAGAVMTTGILAPHTAIEVDTALFWVGRDKFGSGIVYRARGFTPHRISTDAIEYAIQKATDLENMRAWCYQQEGHVFYVLTGGGLETSLVYDLTTGLWHERAFLNEDGDFEQHLGNCHMFAFGKHLVGDRQSGKVYELSLDVYSDNSSPILRERIFTHLSNEDQRIRLNELTISMKTGVGLQSGQGSDPMLGLSISKDMARTFGAQSLASIGKAGEYDTKVRYRRLGIAETVTFKISISDPVPVSFLGAYLR